MSSFHPLRVKQIIRETSDTISIAFDTTGVEKEFNFLPGQYLTIRNSVKGEDIRRAYSICSDPKKEDLRVAVKKVVDGRMSVYLNETLMEGDILQIMTPQGHFVLDQHPASTHVFFVAGSGITPVLSMIKSLRGTQHACYLFYGNTQEDRCIFKNEIDRLALEMDNLQLHYIYSKGGTDALHSGRIDFAKTLEFLSLLPQEGLKHFYICGPAGMMTSVNLALEEKKIQKEHIHLEYFDAPVVEENFHTEEVEISFEGSAAVTILLDDEENTFDMSTSGDCILDVALDNGLDAPFSCKGGVCTSCRAKVLEGKVYMDSNYALTDAEMEEGYVLTCQSHPASKTVRISYDD